MTGNRSVKVENYKRMKVSHAHVVLVLRMPRLMGWELPLTVINSDGSAVDVDSEQLLVLRGLELRQAYELINAYRRGVAGCSVGNVIRSAKENEYPIQAKDFPAGKQSPVWRLIPVPSKTFGGFTGIYIDPMEHAQAA